MHSSYYTYISACVQDIPYMHYTAHQYGMYVHTYLRIYVYTDVLYIMYDVHTCVFTHTCLGILSTCVVPDPPQNLTSLEINAFNASVEWTPALFPNGILQSYELQVTQNSSSIGDDGMFTIMVNGSLTNITIGGLEANTLYSIRVRGFTIGFGDFSDPLSIQTPQGQYGPIFTSIHTYLHFIV